ncbi:MAG TPA: iron-sulfur cluster biosynthesis family protein [Frankiaceae bacterium]|nr:iron-sulfur cluster biosynthesis family protein [Frankiaceae bacterium]
MGDVVTVTDRAAERARELLARHGGAALRVVVQSSGCDGFAALLDVASEPEPDEIAFEDNGVRFYVDVPTMLRLPGATLDHVVTPYGAEFTWTHAATCEGENH